MPRDLVIKVGRDYAVNSTKGDMIETRWTRKLKEATSFPSLKAARETMQALLDESDSNDERLTIGERVAFKR